MPRTGGSWCVSGPQVPLASYAGVGLTCMDQDPAPWTVPSRQAPIQGQGRKTAACYWSARIVSLLGIFYTVFSWANPSKLWVRNLSRTDITLGFRERLSL